MATALTKSGETLQHATIQEYFGALVNRFFKILPMWEDGETSLPVYINSLQMELMGCKDFLPELQKSAHFLTLLSQLEYLSTHPDLETSVVKREVFRSISICNKLKASYTE